MSQIIGQLPEDIPAEEWEKIDAKVNELVEAVKARTLVGVVVLLLTRQGYSLRQIGSALGFSHEQARILLRTVNRLLTEPLSE